MRADLWERQQHQRAKRLELSKHLQQQASEVGINPTVLPADKPPFKVRKLPYKGPKNPKTRTHGRSFRGAKFVKRAW